MSADLQIDKVETWACSLPLSQPLDFGDFQVQTRHHVVIRIRTVGGLVADCVAQSRGSPIDLAVADLVAPLLLGCDASALSAIRGRYIQAMAALETCGVVGRAWSAVEICLHDLRAQAVGWPLWRMLGGQSKSIPVLLVEGYALVGETDEAFAERLAARVSEGFRALKIEAGHYRDPETILRRLRTFRRLVGDEPRLVLDFAWSWRNARSHVGFLAELVDLGVSWIEDPFPRDRVDAYLDVRSRSLVSVGCGDEATRLDDLRALIAADAIDYLRADATTIGGIQSLAEITLEAYGKGMGVSYHEHPEVHEHCVRAFPGVDYVEVFPIDRPFDRVHDLVETSPYERVKDGLLPAPEAAGTGIRLQDDCVRSYAHRNREVSG
jgi:L-alanine-DL-glutamate epimerase-like enolase superfamily enzyme